MLNNKVTDINDYLVFARVAERGSFTRVAQDYELPKSNISRKISRLEADLGVRLLERTTRKLRLTEVGEQIYQHARRIEEELTQSFDTAASSLHTVQGRIRLCTSNTIGIELIAPLLPDFHQQYPNVTIDLQLTNRRVDLIEEGFDLAIRVGHIEDSSLIARTLYQIRLKLFASPDYLNRHALITHPEDLSQHASLQMNAVSQKKSWTLTQLAAHDPEGTDAPTIAEEQKTAEALENTEARARTKDAIQKEKPGVFEISPVLACDDFMVIYQACLGGMGVALLPHYMAEDALKENRLCPVLPDWQGQTLPLYALYPSRKGVTPKLKAVLDYVSAHFQQKK